MVLWACWKGWAERLAVGMRRVAVFSMYEINSLQFILLVAGQCRFLMADACQVFGKIFGRLLASETPGSRLWLRVLFGGMVALPYT